MHKVIEKSEMVRLTANLLRAQGYSGTSIDDIAKACGVTKGSLYHHFAGKEELALAALEQVHDYYREHIFALVRRHEAPDVAALQDFNAAIETFFAQHPCGCLLANLSLEASATVEPFRERIARFFEDWTACYAAVFARYYPRDQARQRAEDALAVVQGCILMNRIRPDLTPLRRQHAMLVGWCA